MTNEADGKEEENRPFTALERKQLRELMEADKRAKWFWATVRVWSGWIAGVAAFVLLVKEKLWK